MIHTCTPSPRTDAVKRPLSEWRKLPPDRNPELVDAKEARFLELELEATKTALRIQAKSAAFKARQIKLLQQACTKKADEIEFLSAEVARLENNPPGQFPAVT